MPFLKYFWMAKMAGKAIQSENESVNAKAPCFIKTI